MTAGTIQLVDKRVVCQFCRARYEKQNRDAISVESAARAVGWIVWEGHTMGGKEQRVVFCPVHAGRVPLESDENGEPKWDAVCHTCDWRASEDDCYDSEPFTEEDAKAWQADHRCEPDVELVRPKVRL